MKKRKKKEFLHIGESDLSLEWKKGEKKGLKSLNAVRPRRPPRPT